MPAEGPWGPAGSQEFLYQLTAQTSLPTLLYNDERPPNSWVEQVKLVDQLGSGPSLIPQDQADRVLMFGLMSELMSEDGFMWRFRLLGGKGPVSQKYGLSERAQQEGPGKMAESVQLF